MRSAATRTLFLGGKICFWGGQNFWVGLLFSEFSVDLQKKKVISPNCFTSSFLSVSKKKSHHLETAARKKGVSVGMLDILGKRNFYLGGRRPFLPPP